MAEESKSTEPKKGLGLLIGLAPKKPLGDSEPPPAGDSGEGTGEAKEMAVKGMMSALKANDTLGFQDALEAFLDARSL